MAAAESGAAARPGGLGVRVLVGALLAVVAIVDIRIGGVAFALMIAAGVALIFWEWGAMQDIATPWRLAGIGVLALVCLLTHLEEAFLSMVLLASAMLLFLALSLLLPGLGRRGLAAGLAYAGLPAIALIWLRAQPDGFALVLWTMGLVWATDIFAYFAGRAIGGPKIWPAISPNKTWAGLMGGMLAAALFSALFAWIAGWSALPAIYAVAGAGLAAAAQAGDFLESWLKRRAGVKDSGTLLPGHGGIMDRVDGLVPVACLVAVWVALQPPVQWVAMTPSEALA